MKRLENNLKEKESKLEDLQKNYSHANETLFQKETEIKSLLDEKLQYQQKSHENAIQIEELLFNLEAERKSVTSLETINKTNEKSIEELKESKNQLQCDLEDLKIKFESLERIKNDSEHQLVFARNEMEKLIDENEKLREEIEALSKMNAEKDGEYQSKYDELSLERDQLEERKEYYKTNCRRLEGMVNDLTEEKNSLKSDFDEIHSILQEKDAKVQE